jgi:uncharacterized protein YcfJ
MNSSMMKGIVIGGIAMVVLSAGAVSYQTMIKPKFADVVAVKEVTTTIVTPREECRDVQVTKQAPVKDEHRIAGSVIGGVAGGVLGNQVGGGSGRTAATVVGAAAGAYAGNRVQKNMQQNDKVTAVERQCRTVNEKSQKVVGYDVTYRLEGKQDVVRMSFDPGKQIPVKDGKLVLTAPETAPTKAAAKS